MKILIATGIYPPDIGGPATYSKLLYDELPKNGIDVSILSFGEVKNFPYVIRHFLYFLKVLKRASGVDVVYAQDPLGVGVPAGIAAKILRKRFIIKIVGDRAWETGVQKFGVKESLNDFSQRSSYSLRIRMLKVGQLMAARLADKIITPSKYLKKIIQNWGIDGGKIKVIYNSFDNPENIEDKKNIRKILNFNSKYIISVGRLVPWKGFDTLINLMPNILKKFSNTKLLIAGDGPEKEKLKNLVNKLELSGDIIFLGGINHKTLLHHLKASDLFVLNTFYEGFSHTLLEAMAMDTPIITTSVGGNPELLDNEKSGILVEYNDSSELTNAILTLLTDDFFARTLADNAKIKVKEFSKERMLSETIEELR